MLERVLVLGILITLVFIFKKKFRTHRVSKKIYLPDNIQVKDFKSPTVLYFWTDDCVQCRTMQKPILENLEEDFGGFNLVDVNALKEKDLTSLFNIKTVPSTVIFSNDGTSKFINNGFVQRNELLKQLEEVRN